MYDLKIVPDYYLKGSPTLKTKNNHPAQEQVLQPLQTQDQKAPIWDGVWSALFIF